MYIYIYTPTTMASRISMDGHYYLMDPEHPILVKIN